MDEYPPGVRAPGEGYTGPIADPEKAMRGYMEFMAEGGGLGRFDADPHAPIEAYLSVRDVWQNPGKYASYARPETAPTPAPAPPPAEAGAIRAVADRVYAAKTEGVAAFKTGRAEPGDFRGDLRNLVGEDGLTRFDALSADEQNRVIAEGGPSFVAAQKSAATATYEGGASSTGGPFVPLGDTPGFSLVLQPDLDVVPLRR